MVFVTITVLQLKVRDGITSIGSLIVQYCFSYPGIVCLFAYLLVSYFEERIYLTVMCPASNYLARMGKRCPWTPATRQTSGEHRVVPRPVQSLFHSGSSPAELCPGTHSLNCS